MSPSKLSDKGKNILLGARNAVSQTIGLGQAVDDEVRRGRQLQANARALLEGQNKILRKKRHLGI